MDTIFIHELKAETWIGAYERERHVPQTVQIDLEIALPSSRACQSDDLADALDYSRVVQRVKEILAQKRFSLLEALAEHIAQTVLTEFGAPWVKVSVAKLSVIRGVKKLGVSLERSATH